MYITTKQGEGGGGGGRHASIRGHHSNDQCIFLLERARAMYTNCSCLLTGSTLLIKIWIVHMSDTYNIDYCVEDFSQNEFLYRMKSVDSPECPLCNDTQDN